MILVKLGGSVLTIKGDEPILRKEAIGRLATELASSQEPLVIVHGAGSFGHPQARRAFKTGDPLALAETHRMVRTLDLELLKALQEAGVPAVTLSPHALARARDGELIAFDTALFRTALEENLVPVTHGDIVPDETRRGAVISGDRFMVRLARDLQPKLALFVTDVDGLYDKDPKLHPGAKLLKELTDPTRAQATRSLGTDVTGGMKGKLAEMMGAARHVDCFVVNGLVAGRVAEVLKGANVIGTWIRRTG